MKDEGESKYTRETVLKKGAGVAAGVAVSGGVVRTAAGIASRRRLDASPIKVGLTNALTGVLSVTEKSIWQGGKLAVEEINAAGGINGRKINAITEDYASDFTIAVQKAQKLVLQDKVAIVIGGYTSASRVSMIPVFQQNNKIFFYGTYYEGLECSPACFYGGAVPNQFLTDYVPWVIKNLGKTFYIVGSDYIYPRTVSAIVQKLAKQNGGKTLADKYFPLGTTEFGPTVADIQAKKPDVLISNMVGDSTIAFYKQYKNAGLTAAKNPIAATVTTEVEVKAMGTEFAKGHFMTATYFQSLKNPTNKKFVAAYKKRWGKDAVTHMPLVGTYQSVYLFAAAASKLKGDDVYNADKLRKALVGATIRNAPEGIPIHILPNHHCNHPSYVGQTNAQGQFDIVATFPTRDANPFPPQVVSPSKAPTCPVPLTK